MKIVEIIEEGDIVLDVPKTAIEDSVYGLESKTDLELFIEKVKTQLIEDVRESILDAVNIRSYIANQTVDITNVGFASIVTQHIDLMEHLMEFVKNPEVGAAMYSKYKRFKKQGFKTDTL